MSRPGLATGTGDAIIWLLFIALLVPAGVVGWVIGHQSSRTVAARNHFSARGREPDRGSRRPPIPAVRVRAVSRPAGRRRRLPVRPGSLERGTKLTSAQLRHIIDHGLGESANPTRPYMPVWGAVISTGQVSELVAYIDAGLPKVPTATPPVVPTGQGPAVAGSVLYVRDGCINCHGPNGLGGVPTRSRRTRPSRRFPGRTSALSSTRTRRSSTSFGAAV